MQENNNRIVYYDYLRVIATFAVVVLIAKSAATE